MAGTDETMAASGDRPPAKRTELLTFLVLAFGVWPFVAVAVVGEFGFLVWMFQIVSAPRDHPPPALNRSRK